MHRLQLLIAEHGYNLLRPGGIMVYSTCSLNPIEDEAVVAALLTRSNGELELMDVKQDLPNFRTRPGLSEWKVFVNDEKEFSDFSEVSGKDKSKVKKTYFSNKKYSQLALEKCARVLPHDQNTGGFFIAKLRKKIKNESKNDENESKNGENESKNGKNELKNDKNESKNGENEFLIDKNESKNDENEFLIDKNESKNDKNEQKNGPKPKRIKINPKNCVFKTIDESLKEGLSKEYGIADHKILKQLFYRTDSKDDSSNPRKIYYLPSNLIEYLKSNNSKIILAGICLFVRENRKSFDGIFNYRFLQQSIDFLEPFINRKKIECSFETIERFLKTESNFINLTQIDSVFTERMEKEIAGTYLLSYKTQINGTEEKISVVVFYKKTGFEMMVGKKVLQPLRRKLEWIGKSKSI
ncbi:tRNA (cytosine(34)-C(5))-methyltransferase [Bonamia ostreae]|uniref:tRNA (Cytosine(34)-C(5))-methyltransferase n=1 Tax=Bonamia ostreae TaxID=126728 RepID=A0ABV2AJR7_9EUKA